MSLGWALRRIEKDGKFHQEENKSEATNSLLALPVCWFYVDVGNASFSKLQTGIHFRKKVQDRALQIYLIPSNFN